MTGLAETPDKYIDDGGTDLVDDKKVLILMIVWKDFDYFGRGFWWLQGRILMIVGKNFDDKHLDLDNSSASDDGETSADAEANLKMMTPMVMLVNGQW